MRCVHLIQPETPQLNKGSANNRKKTSLVKKDPPWFAGSMIPSKFQNTGGRPRKPALSGTVLAAAHRGAMFAAVFSNAGNGEAGAGDVGLSATGGS
jgi:hypothetical protein